MTRRLAACSFAAGLLLLAGPRLFAQFKSSTALVEVDIIARDHDGRFVSGLTSDDFEVLEEGKPQPIQQFFLVTDPANSTADPRPDTVLPRSPDRTERRIFLFYFDSQHLSSDELLRLKQTAVDFVTKRMKPQDLAGVFVNGSLTHGHLSNVSQELLDAIRTAQPALETTEARTRTLLDYPRVDSLLEASRIDSGDRSSLDDATNRNCGGETARQCAQEGGREFVEDIIQRKSRLFMDESRRAGAATILGLQYVIKNLGGLEGRKTLVLFSEGFNVDDQRSSLPIVAGQAARAGVTIYSIDARGTNSRSGAGSGDASQVTAPLSGFGDTSDEGLDVLAGETGGVVMRHIDDFHGALASVENDTSTYYVLAYSPENVNLDGRYRRIALKVKWQGLSVRARRGYVATPLPSLKQLRRKQ